MGRSDAEALNLVILIRLPPIFPFQILNYVFGLTEVSTWVFSLGTFLGMTPVTLFGCYLGSLLENLADLDNGSSKKAGPINETYIIVGSIILSVVLTYLIGEHVKRVFRDMAGSNGIMGGSEEHLELEETNV